MKLYIVAADMGEGPVYVFSSLAAANLYADKEDGVLFEGGEVAGEPSKVWVVFFGGGGCTSGFSGIFLDEASAKNAAQEVENDDSEGYSFWVSEEEILSGPPPEDKKVEAPPPPEDTGEGEVELPNETKDLVLASIWALTGTPAQYQTSLNLAAAAIAHQQLKK